MIGQILDNHFLDYIFSFLDTDSKKEASKVCKRWRLIIKNEKIAKLIQEKFDIIASYPPIAGSLTIFLLNVEVYFLGEMHIFESDRFINAQLINRIWNKKSKLLKEGLSNNQIAYADSKIINQAYSWDDDYLIDYICKIKSYPVCFTHYIINLIDEPNPHMFLHSFKCFLNKNRSFNSVRSLLNELESCFEFFSNNCLVNELKFKKIKNEIVIELLKRSIILTDSNEGYSNYLIQATVSYRDALLSHHIYDEVTQGFQPICVGGQTHTTPSTLSRNHTAPNVMEYNNISYISLIPKRESVEVLEDNYHQEFKDLSIEEKRLLIKNLKFCPSGDFYRIILVVKDLLIHELLQASNISPIFITR